MPAVALSRAGARVVESGPDGEGLAASAWQRLEALPDPRSPQGRIYPLACLIAVAVCAFTAAGNDRLTAVGQWTKRASQADLARLRAPWDRLVPRSLSVLGIVGYALLLAGVVCDLLGIADIGWRVSPAGIVFLAPGGLFELLFPLLLIVRGFSAGSRARPMPVRTGTARHRDVKAA